MEDQFLAFPFEAIVVSPSMVCHVMVLPMTSQKKMTHGHREHITFQCIFISSNFEGDLQRLIHLDKTEVT